jgi:hypothetical protein
MRNMKTLLIAAGAASMAVAAPASAQSAHHILRGAGIGAAGGLIAGAVIPGLSMGNGALIGAAAGGLYNTVHHGHRHYYRHNRYRYYHHNYRHR